MAYPAQVEALVQKGWVWQGQNAPLHKTPNAFVSSGWHDLDKHLGGGWLQGSVNELQVQQPFIGELSLLLPILTSPTATTLWVNPPAMPYAPGLQHQRALLQQQIIVEETNQKLALWAAEQALQSTAVEVVLMWSSALTAGQVRRLQQVAEAQRKLAFVITPWQQQDEARAYVTRLQLERKERLHVAVLKRRFGWPLSAFPCATDGLLPTRRRAL